MHLDELNRRLEAAEAAKSVERHKGNAMGMAIQKTGIVALGVIAALYVLSFAHILGYVPFRATMSTVVLGGISLLAWMHVTLSRASKA